MVVLQNLCLIVFNLPVCVRQQRCHARPCRFGGLLPQTGCSLRSDRSRLAMRRSRISDRGPAPTTDSWAGVLLLCSGCALTPPSPRAIIEVQNGRAMDA